MMQIAKNLITLTLISTILIGSPGVNYALRPMATALLEVPKVKKGMVHIKDLQTGESETATRVTFLYRLKRGKLKNVLVTERLSKKGELRLGKTAYGKPYIVCTRPRHRNRIVQYQIRDGIAVNIAFIGKGQPFKRYKLAIVKGLLSRPVDSFLLEGMMPERVENFVHSGMASSIENLLVGADNTFRHSFPMAYSFSHKGNFAGKKLTAYFWGRQRPLQFSIKSDYGRHNDINAGDVLIVSEQKADNLEQQEIREALFTALYEIPLRIRSRTMAVLMELPRFVDTTGIKKLRMAEHFDLSTDEIDKLITWFRKSEYLKKIIKRYGIGKVSAALKKSILKYRLEIKPPPIPKDGRILIRDMITGKAKAVDRKELI